MRLRRVTSRPFAQKRNKDGLLFHLAVMIVNVFLHLAAARKVTLLPFRRLVSPLLNHRELRCLNGKVSLPIPFAFKWNVLFGHRPTGPIRVETTLKHTLEIEICTPCPLLQIKGTDCVKSTHVHTNVRKRMLKSD